MKIAAKNSLVYWILGSLALLLLAYSATRSALVCFTVDEAFTFQRYVKNSNFFPVEYDMHTANYHMLNTWLMILSSKLFGIAEWALRLPNVLAHAVYLYFSFRFAMKSKQAWSVLSVFILLNVHPYLLDFFSVARGYGLSFGFLAGSLWFVTEYFSNGKQLKHLSLTFLFAGLGMWANFSLLMVFAAIAFIVLIALLFTKNISFRKKLLPIGIGLGISVVFVGVSYPVLSQLQAANAFFWNASGLWNQTVCVLAAKLAYPISGNIYDSVHVADFGMISCMLLLALVIGYSILRNRKSVLSTEPIVLLAILTVVMLQVVIQHELLETPYPSGRTALFLFVLVLWILAASLRDTMLPGLMSRIICGGLITLQVVHGAFTINLTHTSEWTYCADVRNSIREVAGSSDAALRSYGGVVIGTDQEFGNIISYYLQLEEIKNVSVYACSPTDDPRPDYYIVSPYVTHLISSADTIRQFTRSELLILKNTLPDRMKVLAESEQENSGAIVLENASSNRELFTFTYNLEDTTLTRLDLQAHIVFSASPTQCVFQFWHHRMDSIVWSGYYFVDSWENSLSGLHTISRNLPLEIIKGDKITVSAVPYESPSGPIEISRVRAHLQVAE